MIDLAAASDRSPKRRYSVRQLANVLSRPAETGTAAMIVGAALAAYILVYYLAAP